MSEPALVPVGTRTVDQGADILAIVGSTTFKSPQGMRIASDIISATLNRRRPDILCSGESPFGGVDNIAKRAAHTRRLDFVGFPPRRWVWTHPDGGFRERNEALAAYCTRLLCIRCAEAGSYGSGYTADHAEQLGRSVRRFWIDRRGQVLDAPPDLDVYAGEVTT